ncbi:serine/threonine protein phosphatase PrpC [Pontibacter aydingkolensis]|uniref:Protein phosphatase 2C domain-containing protein n=1 Tax=Pontibacter aydingkolensis TaxID=1911536 RepID=A0ABS7CSN9_9BACT|nr:PP2C family serine/threonine-protein phosphatase [Pontibacter aydingkolensis]MBW7466869.1 protein phosphatase 2C domain-containing protein [Pontibacter aydingkolensis]
MIVEIFATTDNGKRSGQNEDNFAVCKDLSSKSWKFKPEEKVSLSEEGALMLVADGMGGANAGEVASDLAQKVIQEQFNQISTYPTSEKKRIGLLRKVIHTAHEKLVEHQQHNLETAGMGTTVVILWLTPQKAYVAWCGDSRLYIHKKGKELKPATEDHSYVWELVKAGSLSAEDARLHPESNIITQSLGDPVVHPKPDVKVIDVAEGDRFLLCSDGLNSMLPDSQIQEILNNESSTVEASKKLIEEANIAGGRDNITVVLLDVIKVNVSVKASPVTTNSTTQELRKFIKVKNRVIVALGLMLVCVVSYLVFAKAIPFSSVNNKKVDPIDKEVKFERKELGSTGVDSSMRPVARKGSTFPPHPKDIEHKNGPAPLNPKVVIQPSNPKQILFQNDTTKNTALPALKNDPDIL